MTCRRLRRRAAPPPRARSSSICRCNRSLQQRWPRLLQKGNLPFSPGRSLASHAWFREVQQVDPSALMGGCGSSRNRPPHCAAVRCAGGGRGSRRRPQATRARAALGSLGTAVPCRRPPTRRATPAPSSWPSACSPTPQTVGAARRSARRGGGAARRPPAARAASSARFVLQGVALGSPPSPPRRPSTATSSCCTA